MTKPRRRPQRKPRRLRPSDRQYGVHMSHCNEGENIGGCKYGEYDICPALAGSMHDKFPREREEEFERACAERVIVWPEAFMKAFMDGYRAYGAFGLGAVNPHLDLNNSASIPAQAWENGWWAAAKDRQGSYAA